VIALQAWSPGFDAAPRLGRANEILFGAVGDTRDRRRPDGARELIEAICRGFGAERIPASADVPAPTRTQCPPLPECAPRMFAWPLEKRDQPPPRTISILKT